MRPSMIIAALLLAFGVWNFATSQTGLKFVEHAEPTPAKLASAGASQ